VFCFAGVDFREMGVLVQNLDVGKHDDDDEGEDNQDDNDVGDVDDGERDYLGEVVDQHSHVYCCDWGIDCMS